IRLSVVPQLLGFYELHRLHPSATYRRDILNRADYLVAHFDEGFSNSAFDGMLGYALLCAYEISGDPRYRSAADVVVKRCLRLQGWDLTLNWGLMGAMALAKDAALNGNAVAEAKVRSVIDGLGIYKNAERSFPHYCVSATDVHYTAWMGMELIVIGRMLKHPAIAYRLRGARTFLTARLRDETFPTYEGPCAGWEGCYAYYYSRGSGCPFDYDTRGWVNELGYHALVFDEADPVLYQRVADLLYGLRKEGEFSDKWGYMPPPDDPIYAWAI